MNEDHPNTSAPQTLAQAKDDLHDALRQRDALTARVADLEAANSALAAECDDARKAQAQAETAWVQAEARAEKAEARAEQLQADCDALRAKDRDADKRAAAICAQAGVDPVPVAAVAQDDNPRDNLHGLDRAAAFIRERASR